MTIGRRIVVAAVCGSCILGGGAAAALAELPSSVRTADPADSLKDQIDKYVDETLKKVASGDAKSGAARDDLCRQVETTTGAAVVPSASFQSVLSSAVVAHIGPLITSTNEVTRLNAAIIISRLAAATKLNFLAPSVQTLLSDATPAVTLWGMKGAGALLAPALSTPLTFQKQKLTPAMVAAAARQHGTAAIVQDAYNALSLPDTKPKLPDNAMGLCAEMIAQIVDLRVKDYQSGEIVDPLADKTALLFLTRDFVWNAMNAQQRLKVVQAISNLMAAATHRAEGLEPGTDRSETLDVVRACVGSMYAAMGLANNSNAVSRYTELLKALNAPGATANEQILQAEVAALAAVRGTDALKDIKDPPAAK